MFKKITVILLALIMVFATGCGKKEEVKESRSVSYDELGLTYTTPDAWREFEATNLYPSAYNVDGVFAIIDYSYVTEADYEKYLSREIDSLDGVLFNICKIAVIENKGAQLSSTATTIFNDFDEVVKADSQDGYDYYVLYNYKGENFLPDADKANYEKMAAAVPELIESVSVYPFDDTVLGAKTEASTRMLTFITKTLEGDDINSSVFADYDLTLVNFWGTYVYPKIDEHAVLQEVYEWIEAEGLNVNIIMAVTDTPSAENEAIALKAKADAGAEFTSIMLDVTLANWVTSNLNGIPTTVLVDNEANIISNKIEGMQDTDLYKNAIISALNR